MCLHHLGSHPAEKGVVGMLSWHGSHFWVCITFCKVRHGDSVTKPDYYYYYYRGTGASVFMGCCFKADVVYGEHALVQRHAHVCTLDDVSMSRWCHRWCLDDVRCLNPISTNESSIFLHFLSRSLHFQISPSVAHRTENTWRVESEGHRRPIQRDSYDRFVSISKSSVYRLRTYGVGVLYRGYDLGYRQDMACMYMFLIELLKHTWF